MAEGTQALFTNFRTGEQLPVVQAIGTASITADQLADDYVNVSGDTMTGVLSTPSGFFVQTRATAEGGQIILAAPTASTSLAGDVVIDVKGNNLRIFENGGSLRGATLNIVASSTVNSSIVIMTTATNATSLAGFIQLAAGVVSSQATLDITLGAFAAYRAFQFVLDSWVPVNDDVELRMQFSTNGGSSYTTSGYRFVIEQFDSNGNNNSTSSAAAAHILLAGGPAATAAVSNVANEGGAHVVVTIYRPSASQRTRTSYEGAFSMAADRDVTITGTGDQTTVQDTDAVRFAFESGNIASGNWALYGYV